MRAMAAVGVLVSTVVTVSAKPGTERWGVKTSIVASAKTHTLSLTEFLALPSRPFRRSPRHSIRMTIGFRPLLL